MPEIHRPAWQRLLSSPNFRAISLVNAVLFTTNNGARAVLMPLLAEEKLGMKTSLLGARHAAPYSPILDNLIPRHVHGVVHVLKQIFAWTSCTKCCEQVIPQDHKFSAAVFVLHDQTNVVPFLSCIRSCNQLRKEFGQTAVSVTF